MFIQPFSEYNIEALARLFVELWPDCVFEEELGHCKALLQDENNMCFLGRDRGEYVAFIHVALRYEYIEGANASPVGYVESIYVRPDFRRVGLGKHLVVLAENWCKEKGCSQIASDAEIRNHLSIAFHKKAGFKEVNRVVSFIKDI